MCFLSGCNRFKPAWVINVRNCDRAVAVARWQEKPEAGDHRPTAGKALARFSQSRLLAARERRPSASGRNGISPHPTNGSVMSRVRIRTAIESARAQNRFGELPWRLLADSNCKKWSGRRDSHPHSPRHRRRCYCYITTLMKWGPWSDSHRRIRVYETRPVAAEAQGHLKLALSRGFAPRTSAFAERRAETDYTLRAWHP
jgi:hypothetical protein